MNTHRHHPLLKSSLSLHTVAYLDGIIDVLENSLVLEGMVVDSRSLSDYCFLCFDMMRGFESFIMKLCVELPVTNASNGHRGKMSLDRYFAHNKVPLRFRSSAVKEGIDEELKQIIIECYEHFTDERNKRFHGAKTSPYVSTLDKDEAIVLNKATLDLIEKSYISWETIKNTK